MPAEYSHGLDLTNAHSDLGAEQFIEHAIQRREGLLAGNGALVVRTGQFTGRSPKDKFIVRDEVTESAVNWCSVNQPISPEQFDNILERAVASLKSDRLFVESCRAGADPEYSLPVRVITQYAWHALFAKQLLIRPPEAGGTGAPPEFTLLFAPEFRANPAVDGTRSETCIILN